MRKTEFWLALAATVVGLFALGLPAGPTVNICGAVLAGLAAVGYTAQRAGVKLVTDAVAGSGKPGYKTTEFWLSVVATLGGAFQPLMVEGNAQAIAGTILAALAGMGYVSSRSNIKKSRAIKQSIDSAIGPMLKALQVEERELDDIIDDDDWPPAEPLTKETLDEDSP